MSAEQGVPQAASDWLWKQIKLRIDGEKRGYKVAKDAEDMPKALGHHAAQEAYESVLGLLSLSPSEDTTEGIPTGECKVAMSGPTCMDPNCPPCQHPEMESPSEGSGAPLPEAPKLLPQDRRRLERFARDLHRGELVTLDSLDFGAIRHICEALDVEILAQPLPEGESERCPNPRCGESFPGQVTLKHDGAHIYTADCPDCKPEAESVDGEEGGQKLDWPARCKNGGEVRILRCPVCGRLTVDWPEAVRGVACFDGHPDAGDYEVVKRFRGTAAIAVWALFQARQLATDEEWQGEILSQGASLLDAIDQRVDVALADIAATSPDTQDSDRGLREKLNATFNRWADTKYAESVHVSGDCEKAKVRATAAAFRNAADYVLDAQSEQSHTEEGKTNG